MTGQLFALPFLLDGGRATFQTKVANLSAHMVSFAICTRFERGGRGGDYSRQLPAGVS